MSSPTRSSSASNRRRSRAQRDEQADQLQSSGSHQSQHVASNSSTRSRQRQTQAQSSTAAAASSSHVHRSDSVTPPPVQNNDDELNEVSGDESEGSGEELLDEDIMAEDYKVIPELDEYDAEDISSGEYDVMDAGA